MGIRFLAILLACVLAACSSGIGPSHTELENKLRVDLPSVWTLVRFEVTAEENVGTPTQRDIRSRFVAKVVLARDLYSMQEQVFGRPLLAKVKSQGDLEKELHGIARSRESGGAWDVKFEFEKGPRSDMPGGPLSDFQNYVIAGSPEEKALREDLAQQMERVRHAREEAEKAEAEAKRIAEEKEKTLNQTTGALFAPGARLLSRWNETRSQRSGVFTFVVGNHDPLTRTFSGTFTYENERPTAGSGSYDGQKVRIAFDNRKCGFDLVATGAIPKLKGTYSGSLLGGCGQGGTIEIGLQ